MKLVDLSVTRPVAVSMAFIAVMVFGLVSYSRLQVDLLPDLSFPTITIETEYAGVGPREVENLISRPVEEAISVVQGVQQVTSRSRPGRSDITLQFRWGTDMDFAALDLRERLDLINLPPDAGRPTIARYDPASEPVIRFALISDRPLDPRIEADRMDLIGLRWLAEEQVRRILEGIEGVAAVRVTGGLEEEVLVEVDEGRLAQLGIPFLQVANRLAAENINLAGGILEEGDAQYVVRTVNEFVDVNEMLRVVVGVADGQPVLLQDVAQVRRAGVERETISLVNGNEAVEIAVLRESTANIVGLSQVVRERISTLDADLPPGITTTLVTDQAVFIERAVGDVRIAAILGGIFAMIILLLFLRHLPTTLIIATAIPISVVATFILMFSRDISLNIMSLGGLALGIGMLVDSAIVVLESIARERERGLSAVEASRQGTDKVARAVIASTLTTVAVFLPIVFVQGIAGQLFGDQAWTVSFALLSALVVALTLIPMLAGRGEGVRARMGEAPKKVGGVGKAVSRGAGGVLRGVRSGGSGLGWLLRPISGSFDRGYGFLDKRYPQVLRAALTRPFLVLGTALVVLAAGVALIPRIGISLVPELSQGELVVEMEAAPGTSLTRMEDLARRAEAMILEFPTVQEVFTNVGVRGGAGTLGRTGERQRHAATLLVRLDALGRDEDRLSGELADRISDIPGVQVRVDRPRLFTVNAPVEVEVRGFDLRLLNELAADVRATLRTLPGVAGVEEERREGTPEISVRFDRDRLARQGLTIAEAAQAVQAKVRGASATEFTERDRDLNVLVRAREGQRTSLEDLANLSLEIPGGGSIALSAVADLGFQEGPAEIIRRGGSRVSLVEARPTGTDLAGAISRIEEAVAGIPTPDDMFIMVAGQSRDLQESVRSMQLALLLAIFLVYLVMASQFESFRLPGVILVSVPLAIPGAVGALWLTGQSLSVVALIGMVMLVGIVVNNAIVLVDYVNVLRREEGYELDEALVVAGRVRLRPILMSTLTTVLGLLPLALIPGEGAELRVPLAIPVIGGLLLSTLLTLLVIPVLYRIFEIRGERARLEGGEAALRFASEGARAGDRSAPLPGLEWEGEGEMSDGSGVPGTAATSGTPGHEADSAVPVGSAAGNPSDRDTGRS
ncbi:MAG: efflux RND transporter permease subunit [Gemmatimonadales bacterium]|nr:MAG: efflux RND transporter permease subunit [Gemmatimonadales bacterium]